MKKLGLLVMPLMAVSLLASCGGNSPKNTYTIDFQGENCSSNLDLSKQYHTGDQVEFTIEVAPDSYKLPDKINVSGVSKFEYSNLDGKVSFKFEEKDVFVLANAKEIDYNITIAGEHMQTEAPLSFQHNKFDSISYTVNVNPGYRLTGEYSINPANSATVEFIDTKTISITPKINSDFTITLETDKRYYYNITASGNNISYYKDEAMNVQLNRVVASTEEDLVFYMVADYEENSQEGFVPPTALDIKVGGLPIPYTIEDVSGTYQNVMKKVTIKKENITGDISINGNAVQVKYYNVVFPHFYGLKEIPYEDSVFEYDSDATIEFEASDSISNDEELLTAENIYVNFTGKEEDWICAADEAFTENTGKFEHTQDNKYILTINAKVVSTEINTIKIIARAKSYHEILDLFSWGQINQMSGTPLATRLFACGDTKTTNEITFRIIDFNKDELAESTNEDPKYAGITFECVNSLGTSYWNNELSLQSTNHNFPSSTLGKACQKDGKIYNAMSAEIKPFIKKVKKQTTIYEENGQWNENATYDAILFPLSKEEISGGSPYYTYYQKGGSRVKQQCDKYWLRSPATKDNVAVLYVADNGSIVTESMCYYYEYDVAPGFCI